MIVWIMQVLGLALNIFIALTHDTKKIYLFTFLFNVVNLTIYILTQDWAACVSGVLITLRSFAYMHKERVNGQWMPWVFISLHIFLGLMLMTNLWQIATIMAPVTVCYTMWFWKGQFQKLRVGNIINAGLWLVYNLHVGLWITALCRLMTIAANLLGMYKEARSRQ